jgi:hypothetical protein
MQKNAVFSVNEFFVVTLVIFSNLVTFQKPNNVKST